jgi:general secretion pathway protein J
VRKEPDQFEDRGWRIEDIAQIQNPKSKIRINRRGFTLLELIVALAMAAILAVSLYTSLHVALKAKERAEAALEPSRTAEVAMEFLRGDFQNAMPPTGLLAGTFEGTDQSDDRGANGDDVNFYSTADGPQHVDANGEMKNVELTIEVPPGSNDHVLVRRVTRNLLSQVQTYPDEEVICRKVAGFNVRYFTGSDWVDNWDSTQEDNTLPAAVEVTLDLEQPNTPSGIYRTVRIFPLPCSTAASDPAVNTGGMLP